MQTYQNPNYRYQVLDRCFSDFRHIYDIDKLLEKVNEHLYYLRGTDSMIKQRQLRADIQAVRKLLPDDVTLEAVPFDGRKCYYRYSKEGFSIFQNQLSVEEVERLSSTIQMLGKYRGLPSNGWLEEVLANLELRFGIKSDAENLVSFGQNEQLKGVERLSEIIDCTLSHQTLEIGYVTSKGNSLRHTLHPYYVKQYNGRWYLFGLDDKEERIKNLALDRILSLEKSDTPFRANDAIDFNTYFDNVVGVTVPNGEACEPIAVRLKFSPMRFGYVTSKPIHHSQRTINDEECTVELRVCPTRELEQQIFSFGPDVEVLSPDWFREQFAEKIALCREKYFPKRDE